MWIKARGRILLLKLGAVILRWRIHLHRLTVGSMVSVQRDEVVARYGCFGGKYKQLVGSYL